MAKDKKSKQEETRESWFKKGHVLARRDEERGANEGLGKRERKALSEENTKPWGKSWWAEDAIKKRARDAGHK
jgi:hypothetical protein